VQAIEPERAAAERSGLRARCLSIEEQDDAEAPPPNVLGHVLAIRCVAVRGEEVAPPVDQEIRRLRDRDGHAEIRGHRRRDRHEPPRHHLLHLFSDEGAAGATSVLVQHCCDVTLRHHRVHGRRAVHLAEQPLAGRRIEEPAVHVETGVVEPRGVTNVSISPQTVHCSSSIM